jgi:hypothetical protein
MGHSRRGVGRNGYGNPAAEFLKKRGTSMQRGIMEERNEIKDIVAALYQVKIAIESLNPDPAQTIQQHRRRQR